MAGAFTPTGTYSNLTRLELEQLRRADFSSGGKALTVGDSDLGAEKKVGHGDPSAEPFFTGPTLNLDDVYPITPPTQPGPGLLTTTTPSAIVSEFARWYGPNSIYDSFASGAATGAATWQDTTLPFTFPLLGVQAGDILVIKETQGASTDQNKNIVATITVVGATTLTLNHIWNPNLLSTNLDTTSGGANKFSYAILRPTAVQLFAVPGSGPKGQEQTFLMVVPGPAIHANLTPTTAAINAVRVKNIVRPNAALNDTVDRADNIYDFGLARSVTKSSLLTLGYRVVLYPDNGAGTGPDLTKPISTLHPIIDPAIPRTDQRMTIDYSAGVVRFSCAPALGGDIKVAGGVHATTGRLNLYAVFWAIDLTLTKGNARGLYFPRSTNLKSFVAGKIQYDGSDLGGGLGFVQGWKVGATASGNEAYVKALGGPETSISSGKNYPFLNPWLRQSAEFGTIERNVSFNQNGLRYISYRQGSNEWRFLNRRSEFGSNDTYAQSEMSIADKTEFTVADASSPAQGFAANMNPVDTFDGGIGTGIRSHINAGLMNNVLPTLAYGSSYGTIHLRRGTYYIQRAIHVPPGMTIEGEGPNTKLIFRNFDSTASGALFSARAVFKIGPNTGWGVWDASSYPDSTQPYNTSITPTTTNLVAAVQTIEGMDMVWNPVRRCWGVVVADATAQAVFFQEYLPDGTARWPGVGINVKDTVDPLHTSSSVMGEHHSGGHYPRLAYHEHADEYIVVWVDHSVRGGGIEGGVVRARYFTVTRNTSQVGYQVGYPYGASIDTVSIFSFGDHPSVAIENFSTGTNYWACVSFWSYDIDAGHKIVASAASRRYLQGNLIGSSVNSSMPTNSVVSSTDVKADELGGFLTVWSVRAHRIVYGFAGAIQTTIIPFPQSYLVEGGGAFNFANEGVIVGSKFHYLKATVPANQGFAGIIWDMTTPTQPRIKAEVGVNYGADVGPVYWAITPPSKILGQRASYASPPSEVGFTQRHIVDANFTASTSNYQLELREPDYVRLSRGANGWCVAFQGFNSDSWTAAPSVANYANGAVSTPVTFITLNDQHVYREHVSTCAVLLNNDGSVVHPNETMNHLGFPDSTSVFAFLAQPGFAQRLERDIEVSGKSLGTRDPITHRPNYQTVFSGLRVPYNAAREVAYHNYSYRWTDHVGATPYQGVQAIIPGITWTGQDWVIVSPAKNKIHSFTGNYIVSGPDSYLSDATFYFGNDAAGADNFGWFLRQSIAAGAQIYFPSTSTFASVTTISDEHTVHFVGSHPAGAISATNLQWVLVVPDAPDTAGVKNQGFRINPDGKILASTNFVTWADEPDENESSLYKRNIELMRRTQARGGNYPAIVAGDGATESTDFLEPGSRYKANINFRGVAPGRPKGTSIYNLVSSPTCAIAWGENLYGFLDHLSEGFGPANTLQFFRQTFGPYNVTLKNFSVEATATRQLTQLSKSHVFTRHYAPVASTLSFDTDGFRNVYVYPASRVLSGYHAISLPQVTSLVRAVYTDARGMNPMTIDGPGLGRGDMSMWCSDVTEDVPLANAIDQLRTLGQGVGPKVIWDGQRFAIFWIERANRSSGTVPIPGIDASAVGYFLCHSYLPGNEDAGLQGSEMVPPVEFTGVNRFPLSSMFISDGSGVIDLATSNYPNNTVAVCDAAFSGKTYAVVWAAGTVPFYDTTLTSVRARGSVLGVTIFGLDSALPAFINGGTGVPQNGGGVSYVIEQFQEPGAYHNPKIIWDGARYVVFFETTFPSNTANPPTLDTHLAFSFVPEDGISRPTAVKKMAASGVMPGTDYSTNYPGTAGPFSAAPTQADIGLGYCVGGGTAYAAGAPTYGATTSIIQTFGATIFPQLASGVGVTGAGGYTVTDGAAAFITAGVRPGDYIFIIGEGGYFLIESVAATVITVDSSYHAGFTGAGGIYLVLRHQQPMIQPGDVLVVSKTRRAGTFYVDSAGVYPILNYDPRRRQLTVQGNFTGADFFPKGDDGYIFGEIRSAGLSEYDNAANLPPTRAGVSPRAYPVQNPNWASAGTTSAIARLHGVAYNDVDDEFACFVTHLDGLSGVFTFRPDTRSGDPERILAKSTTEVVFYGSGDIAWNGSHYLVVAPWYNFPATDGQVKARLLNPRLGTETDITLLTSTFNPTNPNYLFGNSATQIPGPGYGAFPAGYTKAAGTVYPVIQQVKAKWNDRLSRWVVSASVLWYDQVAYNPSWPPTYLEYGIFDSTTPTINAWVLDTITLSVATSLYQPGMKIVITDGAGGLPQKISAVVTVISLVGAGPTYNQIKVDAHPADLTGVNIGASLALPVCREDVITWTLGQDTRGIIVQDADNVHVENVVINGATTDIEEIWPNMGRPIWQASGQTWGQPTNVTFANVASLTRQPQYNHRLMTPAGKVNLPKYVNVTSSGKHPYGRKAPPGAPYNRDRLRNRRGG